MLKFKKIADLTRDHHQLANVIRKHGSLYFDISNDMFRRIQPYEWDQVKKKSLDISLCKTLVVAASGFGSSVTEEEVKIFLGKCGKLAFLSRDSSEPGTWNMFFESFDALLAAMNLNLEYQDSKIKLVCKRYRWLKH